MSLPLLALNPLQTTDAFFAGSPGTADECATSLPLRALNPLQSTNTFFAGTGVSADDRLLKLKMWFELNEDGSAKHPDTQPTLNDFGLKEVLPSGRKVRHFVYCPGENRNMCNLMTWAMIEASVARREKYKRLVENTSIALKQAAKATGFPIDYQQTPSDTGNPQMQSFLSIQRRSKQLATLEREAYRRLIGVMKSLGEAGTEVNFREMLGIKVVEDEVDRKLYDDINQRAAPTTGSFLGSAPTLGTAMVNAVNALNVGEHGEPRRPFFWEDGEPFGRLNAIREACEMGDVPDWMKKDPIVVPDDVELTPKMERQMECQLEKRQASTLRLKASNDERYEKQRKEQLDKYDTYKDDDSRRYEMQLARDLRALEEEEKKREAEKGKDNEGPLPMWTAYEASKEAVAVLDDILKNYSGNDGLKDLIYQDVVSFLGDPAGTMDDYRNYAFMGPSGVGKTTWARLMGRLYKAIGMYLNGVVAETNSSDYISNYMGQTGAKTAATLNQNLENIILIDEAYSITYDKYGSDAITAIVDWMDKNIGMYMIIVAGYESKLNEQFFAANEGLDRRFNNKFVFQPYTPSQLVSILKSSLDKFGLLTKWDETVWTDLGELIQQGSVAAPGSFSHDMYKRLFGKQAGSMTNIAARAKAYMRIPDKKPAGDGKSVAGKYKYNPHMMEILLSDMPLARQNEYSDADSETYKFLNLPNRAKQQNAQ
jgi:hypothetical protein